MSSRDDEELASLLSELETTLEDLRTELDDERRGGRPRRDDRSSDPPRRDDRPSAPRGRDDHSSESRRRDDRSPESRRRDDRSPESRRRDDSRPRFDPPSVGDVLRFTEEYTIPTLIATLEATIKALELFRKVLGVATPGDTRRSDRRDRSGPLGDLSPGPLDDAVTDASSRASEQLANRLDDLRTALSETDLPQNDEARDIVADARSLADEIESRVRESRDTVSDAKRRERDGDERGGDRRGDRTRRDRRGDRRGRRGDDNQDRRRDGDRRRDDGHRDRRRDDHQRDDRRGGRNRRDGQDDGPVEISVGGPDDGNDDRTGDDRTDDDRTGDNRTSSEPAGDQSDDTHADVGEETTQEPDDPPEVDVEAELQSIKREMDEDTADENGTGDEHDGAGEDESSGDDSGRDATDGDDVGSDAS
jgi:hypothetical protein